MVFERAANDPNAAPTEMMRAYAQMQRDYLPDIVLMGTDILADLKAWLKRLARDQWHEDAWASRLIL